MVDTDMLGPRYVGFCVFKSRNRRNFLTMTDPIIKYSQEADIPKPTMKHSYA